MVDWWSLFCVALFLSWTHIRILWLSTCFYRHLKMRTSIIACVFLSIISLPIEVDIQIIPKIHLGHFSYIYPYVFYCFPIYPILVFLTSSCSSYDTLIFSSSWITTLTIKSICSVWILHLVHPYTECSMMTLVYGFCS